MRNTERLYDRVIEKMDMTCDMEDEELQELIHEVLEEASKEEFIPLQEKIRISKELFNAFRKLDILQELIEDDEITEIMINGTDHIFLEKAGRIFESDRRFVSVAKLEDVIQQIAAGANRSAAGISSLSSCEYSSPISKIWIGFCSANFFSGSNF